MAKARKEPDVIGDRMRKAAIEAVANKIARASAHAKQFATAHAIMLFGEDAE